MKIAIIGAGIVGVTTAYELSRDGHEVTVFERRSSVAAENSFANAGAVSPLTTSWAVPGLFARHRRLKLRGLSPGTLPWLWRYRRAATLREEPAQQRRLQRLAIHSRALLQTLNHGQRLDYERSDGLLVLLRSAKEMARAKADLLMPDDPVQAHAWLDADECRRLEPGLAPNAPLHGGLHLPQDEIANCRQFTHLLRAEAGRLGARFRFRTRVLELHAGPQPRITHRFRPPDDSSTLMMAAPEDLLPTLTMLDQPITEPFDAVVICAALGSPKLLRSVGVELPMQAIHGYSLTAPLRRSEAHADLGPRSALMDARFQISISRIGARVRVAGIAEIGGKPSHQYAGAFDPLFDVLHDWFPGSARLSQAQRWKGARPMLPDGAPVIGRSGADGIWLNLGHGAAGWTLACGSARLLADAIGERPAGAIGLEGFGIERLRGGR